MTDHPSAQAESAGPDDALPTLFCLHHLGGSAREWLELAGHLSGLFTCVPLDLPGFGDAAHKPGFTVREMADAVAAEIIRIAPKRWALVGHSMGAKVAATVARRAEAGEPGLAGLFHLVLLAGSPPAPEPMDEKRRSTMLGWFKGGRDQSRGEAEKFVLANAAAALDPALHARAVDDVLRTNPAAWAAWLDSGSREDWRDTIGVLKTPALILAGKSDGDLGPAAQKKLMQPHFAEASVEVVDGTAHLLPYERPAEVAGHIIAHVLCPSGSVPSAFWALVASSRVSSRTRATLVRRGAADDPSARPAMLTDAQLRTLRAVVARLVPHKSPVIDLAIRIDKTLAEDKGDGWRPAVLPSDGVAYRRGLSVLDRMAERQFGNRFVDLVSRRQDEILAQVAEGSGKHDGLAAASLTHKQMQAWFEELNADAVRHYVSHPATMARMGYAGFANGGDGNRMEGFIALGIGEREPWEPAPMEASR